MHKNATNDNAAGRVAVQHVLAIFSGILEVPHTAPWIYACSERYDDPKTAFTKLSEMDAEGWVRYWRNEGRYLNLRAVTHPVRLLGKIPHASLAVVKHTPPPLCDAICMYSQGDRSAARTKNIAPGFYDGDLGLAEALG